LPVLGNLGFANTTFSDADFIGTGIVLGFFAQYGSIAISSIVIVLFALPFILSVVPKKKTE
jgi:PTS system ascorbate-specific IIC component